MEGLSAYLRLLKEEGNLPQADPGQIAQEEGVD